MISAARTFASALLLWMCCAPALAFEPDRLAWLTRDVNREKTMAAIRDKPAETAKLIAEWRWDACGARPDKTFRCVSAAKDWIEVRLNSNRTGWVRRSSATDSDGFIAFLLDRILLMEEYAAGVGRFKGLLPLDRDGRLAELKARKKDDKRAARVLVHCLTRHVSHESLRIAVRNSTISDRGKSALVSALGKNDKEAVAKLIAKLGKSDVAGSVASKKLAAIGSPAIEPLLKQLRSPDRRVRYWAIPALCGTRDLRVVPPVAELMRKDEDTFVRSVAAYHLSRLPSATEALIAQLRVEKHHGVAGWIARGLVEANRVKAAAVLAGKTNHPAEKVRVYALKGIVKFRVANAHQVILQHARTDASANVRSECIKLLGWLGRRDRKTREVLAAELNAPQPARRWHAIKSLRKLSGLEYGYDPAKTTADNAAAIASWNKWCEK